MQTVWSAQKSNFLDFMAVLITGKSAENLIKYEIAIFYAP